MRFYNIIVSNATNGKAIQAADGSFFGPYSSQNADGTNNPGALNIEFDIPVFSFDASVGAAFLKIYGIGLPVMGQSSNFNGANIQIFAGMQKGLPLASAQPMGALILQSMIQQAYGNWEGTQQSLDFQIFGQFGTQAQPVNLVFNWMPGQQMADAITQTLTTAFPGAKITSNVSQNLMLPYETQPGYWQSLDQFAQYVLTTSQSIIGGNYAGIRIVRTTNGFYLFDGTVKKAPRKINFIDLIGQPTWINFQTINFKTVMRADIAVGDYVQMPKTSVLNTPQSFSQYRNAPIFQGCFQVIDIRHLGHYKQASAESWVTVFDAVYTGDCSGQ